jgi:hypothetical protein
VKFLSEATPQEEHSYETVSMSKQQYPDRNGPDFNDYADQIHSLLRKSISSSPEVISALESKKRKFPAPPVEVVQKNVWDTERDILVIKSHLQSRFEDVVRNIEWSGHDIDTEEKQWLKLILSHWCGWSSTPIDHMNDAWVSYLQSEYRHLKGLVPILDTLVWPEELKHYPIGQSPPDPTLFLLANFDSYYVFHLEDASLYNAGKTLADLYVGLKEYRYHGNKKDDWKTEPLSIDGDPGDYFPVYHCRRNASGGFDLESPLKSFAEWKGGPDDDKLERAIM